jgi:Transglutaminase-like superfamily
LVIDYSAPGIFTGLDAIDPSLLDGVPTDPVDICRLAGGLVIEPRDADALGVPAARSAERNLRPAASIVAALLARNPAPLDVPRTPEQRTLGTCRHFAVLSCALLRHRGIPSRVRCGFATYFQPGKGLDHWITEYRLESEDRWVRIDSEILGQTVLHHPEDLSIGEFLTGGEAWALHRADFIDSSQFGVAGTDHAWGPAEIRANAIKDLAALNRVEMLPWDEWGRMVDSFQGRTGADYDELLDLVAAACEADDPEFAAAVYQHEELRVPAELMR